MWLPADPRVLAEAATVKGFFERDFDAALTLYERSLSLNPNSHRSWNGIAIIHSLMGNTDAAMRAAEHAIALSPHNPAIWFAFWVMADAQLQEKQYEQAVDFARKALQFNENARPAYHILAAAFAHLRRLDDARKAINKALAFDPNLTITRFQEIYPVAQRKDLDGYLDGLREAGLPE